MLYLLDTVGGRLSAAGRRHAAQAVARLGAMAPGNKAAEAAIRAACGCSQVPRGIILLLIWTKLSEQRTHHVKLYTDG